MSIDQTQFDNEISILYKWGRQLNVPIKLILISPTIVDGIKINVYTNSITTIGNFIKDDNDLETIYNKLNLKLNLNDIIMIYSQYKIDKVQEINALYEKLLMTDRIKDNQELKLLINDWKRKINDALENDLIQLEDL